jgi:hypothetical protein
MDPAIQAEIARQVALAMQQDREDRRYVWATKQQSGPPPGHVSRARAVKVFLSRTLSLLKKLRCSLERG